MMNIWSKNTKKINKKKIRHGNIKINKEKLKQVFRVQETRKIKLKKPQTDTPSTAVTALTGNKSSKNEKQKKFIKQKLMKIWS